VTARAVAKKLGGRRVLGREMSSELELAVAVRAGLPSSALDFVFAKLGEMLGSEAEVYRLIGSARTLRRKRAEGTHLSVRESDRLARIARLIARAEEALGDENRAQRWMLQPNRALGRSRPLMLLDTDAGARAVEQVLGRIEGGVYS